MEILQPEELNLLENKEIFLLKRSTGDKITQILGDSAERIRAVLESGVRSSGRGDGLEAEDQQGRELPGLPLDHPRLSTCFR
jgi:hypothetical protein